MTYRICKCKAVIVHVCIDESFRGITRSASLTQALFDKFLENTRDINKNLYGTLVKCRKDYNLSGMWRQLGFKQRGTCPAKAQGRVLEKWWFDFDRPSLFDLVPQPIVVLDSSVFFDIYDETEPHHEDSRVLLADWLVEDFQLSVTPELLQEIKRSDDQKKVRVFQSHERDYPHITGNQQDSIYVEIESSLMATSKPSRKSDHRHLAHAIAGQAQYFITRDERLLKRKKQIQGNYGLNVLKPVEFIKKIDEEANALDYMPASLHGSEFNYRALRHNEADHIVKVFLNCSEGEKKHNLRSLVERSLSTQNPVRAMVVTDSESNIVGLVVFEENKQLFKIEALRFVSKPFTTTLVWHVFWDLTNIAIDNKSSAIQMSDKYAPRASIDALNEIGYVQCEEIWYKYIEDGIVNFKDKGTDLPITNCPEGVKEALTNTFETAQESKDQDSNILLLKRLWPAQIINCEIPCYIVPINYLWAKQLFDKYASDESLFKSDHRLLLSFENVYYRSVARKLPTAGSRLLWYVSEKRHVDRSKVICAASIVNEVSVGTPSELYKRYNKYGVYTYKNLETMAKKRKMTAFTFSHTTLFEQPVKYRNIIKLFEERQVNHNNFVAPMPIDERIWIEIYYMGQNRE